MIRSYSDYSQDQQLITIQKEDTQELLEGSSHLLEKFIPEISNVIISFLNFKDLSVLAQVNSRSHNLAIRQLIYHEGKADLKTDKLIRFFKNFTL